MRRYLVQPTQVVTVFLTCVLFTVLSGCNGVDRYPPTPVVTVASGSGQSAVVGSPFGAPLVATVTVNGTPSTGVSVIFTAPAENGSPGPPVVPNTVATCTFANGTTTETDTTDATGTATSSICTTTTVSGAYNIAATTLPAAGAPFSMTNMSGPPNAITATSGTPQTADVSTAFADPLVATVVDSDGNPVTGASVTFTAPSSGASGTFANGTATETDTTDANGNATSTTFTANATSGGPYTVTATVTGVATAADFSLTNQ